MDAMAFPGAACAVHPGQPFAFTCSRCGAFGCELCRTATPGGSICAACAARELQPFIASEVIREAFGLSISRAPVLMMAMIFPILGGIWVGIDSALHTVERQRELMRALQTSGTDLGAMGAAYARMMAPMLYAMVFNLFGGSLASALIANLLGPGTGEPPTLGEAWAAALKRWPLVLVGYVIWTVVGMLGMFACVVPGLFFMVVFSLATVAVAWGDAGPFAALGRSWRLVLGRFWAVVGVEAVCFAALIACSMVAAVASGLAALGGTEAKVAVAIVSAIINGAASLPFYTTQVVAYRRLRARIAA